MGKSRADRRGAGGKRYNLYAAETVLGWRVLCRVSGAQGEEMLAQGRWRDVYDAGGNHVGYQLVPNRSDDQEILSRSSVASITVRECELNAGAKAFKGSRSRTSRMTEAQRENRRTLYGHKLPEEDATERAEEKVRIWPELQNAEPGLRVCVDNDVPRENSFLDIAEEAEFKA